MLLIVIPTVISLYRHLKMPNKFNCKILYSPPIFSENVTLKPSNCGIRTALQLRHFNAFVTELANYDDLFRPVAR